MSITTRTAALLGSACLLLAITGCGQERLVRVPVKQEVIVEKYRPLPDNVLTVPRIIYPKTRTIEEVVKAYNFNTPQLEQCIVNMQGIIKLQPQK